MVHSSLMSGFLHGAYHAVKEKSGMVAQLDKEKQKKREQMQQAHADLARQAALIKDLQAHPRGKKEAKEGGVSVDQVCSHITADTSNSLQYSICPFMQ